MSSLVLGYHNTHDAVQICLWLLFFGLAVAINTAHADEATFAAEKNALTTKHISSDIRRQLPYRFNSSIALNSPYNALSSGKEFNRTPRLSFFSEPQKEDGWSVNIQKEAPSSSNCSPLSFLKCFDSNDDRADDGTPQKESFWLVLRKAFHF